MKFRRTGAAVALATVAALAAPTAPALAGSGAGAPSLADVLAADGNKFDRNWNDFDILHRAVTTVLKAKPDSAVAVLADGDTALTAFAPTDRAFRKLAGEIGDMKPRTERATFRALAGAVDVDTLESVLLYHVVPGATITYKAAKASDGAELTTALGSKITVRVTDNGRVVLRDADTDDRNPRVIARAKNINQGNPQIAHGIDRVLRPVDLP